MTTLIFRLSLAALALLSEVGRAGIQERDSPQLFNGRGVEDLERVVVELVEDELQEFALDVGAECEDTHPGS